MEFFCLQSIGNVNDISCQITEGQFLQTSRAAHNAALINDDCVVAGFCQQRRKALVSGIVPSASRQGEHQFVTGIGGKPLGNIELSMANVNCAETGLCRSRAEQS